MREVSQLLAVAVGSDGKPAAGFSLEQVKQLYGRAFSEFQDSAVFQELLRRTDEDIYGRIIEICAERYATSSPAQTPFYEVLEEIGRDLLAITPPPQAPKAAPKPKVVVAPAVVVPKEAPPAIAQFSHIVNEAIKNFGVGSLKARAGFVTVKLLNDRHYDYPYQEFEKMYQAASDAGLIR